MKLLSIRLVIGAMMIFSALEASAGGRACEVQRSSIKISSNVVARVGIFEDVAPQGALIFINGPESRFDNSKSLIQNFCRHGFSVFAFNVVGRRPNPAHYLKAARLLSDKIHRYKPRLPIAVYGFSKGTFIATQLVGRSPTKYARLILESPELTVSQASALARIPRRTTRIFACPTDKKVHFKNLKYTSRAFLYAPAHASCLHHLSANPEARDPMVDFVESDFAGVEALNWYWTRKL